MTKEKNSCKKWFIFPDHYWTSWGDVGTYKLSRNSGTYEKGTVQERRCRKCGILETRRVSI